MVNVGGVKTRKTFVGCSTVLLAVIYAVVGSRGRLEVREEMRRVNLCNTEHHDYRSCVHPKVRIYYGLQEPGFEFR
jgi:hypothetical protein